MRVLFLAQHKWPHVGGVERHVYEVSKRLEIKGHNVKVISSEDINYPKIKYLGLLYIWFWFFKNINLIRKSDIVHCHDVFIWYLPFRFLIPNKKVFTTFHGWEGKYPIPWKNVLLKRLANKLSMGSFVVGRYIEKWYGIKGDIITYGAA
ncbi:MAG: glycosyltransferase [Patescibacteria group bacterium]